MLITKTFRVFNIKNWKYLGVYSVCVIIFCVFMRMDVFNVEGYVPEPEEIEWAALDCEYTSLSETPEEIQGVRELTRDFS